MKKLHKQILTVAVIALFVIGGAIISLTSDNPVEDYIVQGETFIEGEQHQMVLHNSDVSFSGSVSQFYNEYYDCTMYYIEYLGEFEYVYEEQTYLVPVKFYLTFDEYGNLHDEMPFFTNKIYILPFIEQYFSNEIESGDFSFNSYTSYTNDTEDIGDDILRVWYDIGKGEHVGEYFYVVFKAYSFDYLGFGYATELPEPNEEGENQ